MADSTVQQAIYRLNLDVADYHRSAQQKVQDDAAMVAAAARITESSERVSAAVRAQGTEVDKLVGRVDRETQLQQRRLNLLEALNRRLQDGSIDTARYADAVQRVNRSVDTQIASLSRSTLGFRGAGAAAQQFGYQIGDLAVQIASGQGVIRPLIQQGTQLVQAFGPWGAVLGAAAAVAGAFYLAMDDGADSAAEAKKQQEAYTKAVEDYYDLVSSKKDLDEDRINKREREIQGILAGTQATLKDNLALQQGLLIRRQQEAEFKNARQAAIRDNPTTSGVDTKFGPNDSLIRLIDETNKEIQDTQDKIDALQRLKEIRAYEAEKAQKEADLRAPTEQLAAEFPSQNSPPNAANIGAVTTQIEQQRVLNEQYKASVAQRQEVLAILKLETSELYQNADAKDKLALRESTLTAIRVQNAAAANDNIVSLRLETDGALRIAEAYGRSQAAGIAMEAQVQAEAAAFRNSQVNVEALTKALRDKAAADSLVAGVKAVDALHQQADAAEKLLVASRQGAEASQEAQRQLEVEAFSRQQVAAAGGVMTRQLGELVAAYDEESKRRLTAQQDLARETALRQASQQATIAAAKARAAAIADPAQRQAAELQIERQQKINELTLKYGQNVEQINKELAQFDATQAAQEQERFWGDIRKTAQSYADDIKGFLLDGLTGVYNNGKSIFQNLWDAALAGAKRFAINLALTLAEQQFVLPIVTQLVGSAPGLFGVVPPQVGASGVSGGTGGFGGLSNLASLASSGYQALTGNSLFSGVGNALSGVGQWLGFGGGAAAAGAGAAAGGSQAAAAYALSDSVYGGSTLSAGAGIPWAGALGAAGLGFAGGSLLASLTGGNQLGGGIGGGIGAGLGFLVGGPIGAVIGGAGGSIIGGLFGPGKSVGPNGNTVVGSANGRLFVGGSGADNGANAAVTIQMAQELVTAVNKLADLYSLSVNGSVNLLQGNGGGFGFKDSGSALQYLLDSGAISSDNATTQTILQNSRGKPASDLEANLQFGQLYDSMTKLARVANDSRDSIEALSKAFDENSQKAKDLGLSQDAFKTGVAANENQNLDLAIKQIVDPLGYALDRQAEVAQARLDYIQKIGGDMVKAEQLNALQRLQIIQQSGGDLNAWLQAQVLGSTSTLNTQGRFAAAQDQFSAAVSAARNGTGGTAAVTQLGDVILGLSQQLYGGSTQAAAIEQMVRSTISGLGKDLGLPGFAGGGDFAGGLRIVGERGWEIEATGPARYWNQQQIGAAVSSSSSDQMAVARSMARSGADMAASIRRLEDTVGQLIEDNRRLNAQLSRYLNKQAA